MTITINQKSVSCCANHTVSIATGFENGEQIHIHESADGVFYLVSVVNGLTYHGSTNVPGGEMYNVSREKFEEMKLTW